MKSGERWEASNSPKKNRVDRFRAFHRSKGTNRFTYNAQDQNRNKVEAQKTHKIIVNVKEEKYYGGEK